MAGCLTEYAVLFLLCTADESKCISLSLGTGSHFALNPLRQTYSLNKEAKSYKFSKIIFVKPLTLSYTLKVPCMGDFPCTLPVNPPLVPLIRCIIIHN